MPSSHSAAGDPFPSPGSRAAIAFGFVLPFLLRTPLGLPVVAARAVGQCCTLKAVCHFPTGSTRPGLRPRPRAPRQHRQHRACLTRPAQHESGWAVAEDASDQERRDGVAVGSSEFQGFSATGSSTDALMTEPHSSSCSPHLLLGQKAKKPRHKDGASQSHTVSRPNAQPAPHSPGTRKGFSSQ